MSLYSQVIFPRLLDWSMSGQPFAAYRQDLLKSVQGHTLEIGFGTGLNLPHYPDTVTALTVVDPNPGCNAIATRRIAASNIHVDIRPLSGENLPFADASFDSVVSTWTLCSILKVEKALQEIYRVLKPGGRFFFIEHGQSPDADIRIWQNRLTPLQKRIADGCHLNRPIKDLVAEIFGSVKVDEFYAEGMPKVAAYFYQGTARK
ncbi:MAG: class I SAM-dependent methyltransferase [Cyanobacteria bacterium P01_A01_bin.114]